MANQQRSTVVGVFADRNQADQAVSELRQAGFRNDQIGVAGRHAGETSEAIATASEEGTHAGTGAVTGALAGAGVGGLVGLGIISGLIPAIGPVIAGGTLAAILANAAGGAAIGTLAGSLIGAGIPEEEAQYYHSEFEQGRTIVTVKAEGRADEATTILRRHGAYDMHTAATRTGATAATTTSSRVSGATSKAVGGATGTAVGSAATGEACGIVEGGQTIKVHEEELHAAKKPVTTGEVTVRKDVVTEHKTLDVPVTREEVVIERHAPTGKHTASTADIREGQEVRIPVTEEKVVVEKQPVVKEEVTVGKRVVHETERVAGDVRKEQVRVERQGDVDVNACQDDRGKK